MKKLLLIPLLAFSCQEGEIESCQCSKYTYESRLVTVSGLPKLRYVETNREPVECQDEKQWDEGKYLYKIKCY